MLDPHAPFSDRMLAVEFAGEFIVINDDLIEALLAIVGRDAEPIELRAKAAISFGPALEATDDAELGDLDSDAPLTQETGHFLQEALESLYRNAAIPAEVRRRILEASVRSPQDWHHGAVRAAWASGNTDWMLTAVFCMRFIRGFEGPIVDALRNGRPDFRLDAVCAAGNWQLDAAWEHVVPFLAPEFADKPLLIAAIEAVACIRPDEAVYALKGLLDNQDEDIALAIEEALATAESEASF